MATATVKGEEYLLCHSCSGPVIERGKARACAIVICQYCRTVPAALDTVRRAMDNHLDRSHTEQSSLRIPEVIDDEDDA